MSNGCGQDSRMWKIFANMEISNGVDTSHRTWNNIGKSQKIVKMNADRSIAKIGNVGQRMVNNNVGFSRMANVSSK